MSLGSRLAFAAALVTFLSVPAFGTVLAANLRAETELGARLAPPDLARQIVRRAAHFRAGVEAVRSQATAPDAAAEARRAVEMLRRRSPFDPVIEQVGRAAAATALAGQPLQGALSDPSLAADFQRYIASIRPRAARVVYPRAAGDLEPQRVLGAARARVEILEPSILREYRRVGGLGASGFDDRSTAFAVAALSLNHAASDVAHVLRWIWREAGGADRRVQIVRGPDGSVLVLGSSSVTRPAP